MPRAKKSNSWADVKSALRDATPAQLIDVIRDLYRLGDDNRQFLHTRCLGSDVEFESFRARVAESVFPDPLNRDRIRLSEARRAIREFERASGDSARTLDLMLIYVEQGTEQSVDLGYGEDSYFSSLESMLEAALAKLVAEPAQVQKSFLPRLARLADRADGIGWGYGDSVRTIIDERLPAVLGQRSQS